MAKKKKLVSQLPPTPCTPEMRDRIVTIADEQGRSIAEIQRDAITLFLQNHDRNTVIEDGLSNVGNESA